MKNDRISEIQTKLRKLRNVRLDVSVRMMLSRSDTERDDARKRIASLDLEMNTLEFELMKLKPKDHNSDNRYVEKFQSGSQEG